jgi:carboxyl-terminal processing protease
MRIITLLAIASSLFISAASQAQVPDSVKNYIDTALSIMQKHSLYAQKLNWDHIKDSVYSQSRDAKNYGEAFPALGYAFRQLNDKHGMIANADTFYRLPPKEDPAAKLSEGIKKEYLKGPRITTSSFEKDIVYLKVPAMIGARPAVIESWANQLRDSLCMLLAKNPKGIIIDLRMNNGGNMVPMLSGLGPLLGNDVLGYDVDREGRFTDTSRLVDGVAAYRGEKMVEVKRSCSVSKPLPIAVLIGYATASSGEIIAVFLSQMKNTRTFGESTAGFLNATQGFLFMERQGYILLSNTWVANAKGRVYREELVKPDVFIKSADNYDNLSVDPTVIAALKWLRKK